MFLQCVLVLSHFTYCNNADFWHFIDVRRRSPPFRAPEPNGPISIQCGHRNAPLQTTETSVSSNKGNTNVWFVSDNTTASYMVFELRKSGILGNFC